MDTFVNRLTRIARRVSGRQFEQFARQSYAQEGEDLILQRLFDAGREPEPGFYVDIGAHHPHRFSNTFMFYEAGWRGINVDAMPGSMAPFLRHRPRDINIEAAISDTAETLTYHLFNEPALNGFCETLANERDGVKTFRIIGRMPMQTRTLESVFREFLPTDQPIDFMSVDVEGVDLKVLRSNDWHRYRPTYLLAEDAMTGGMQGAMECDVATYLNGQEYDLCAKAVHTMFFRDRRRS